MRQFKNIIRTGLVLFSFLPIALFAQSTNFKPLVLKTTPESRENTKKLIREADAVVLKYVSDSINSIAQGQRQGFADFHVYYRKREAALKQANSSSSLLKAILESCVTLGVNFVLPGSGNFIAVVKEAASTAGKLAVGKITEIPKGDISRFLAGHDAMMESYISGLLEVRDKYPSKHAADIEVARDEYIFENIFSDDPSKNTSSVLGPQARKLMTSLGVPEPGKKTIQLVRERTLERQIFAVFNSEKSMRTFHSGWQISTLAKATAIRHINPKDINRICRIEQRLGYTWMNNDCREWLNKSR